MRTSSGSKAMSPRRTRSGCLINCGTGLKTANAPPMVVIKEEMIDEVDDKVAAIEQVSISEFFYEPILLILNAGCS